MAQFIAEITTVSLPSAGGHRETPRLSFQGLEIQRTSRWKEGCAESSSLSENGGCPGQCQDY